MRLLNFLSSIAPVLVCLAAPDDAAGGGAAAAPQPPEPTGATGEEKLASAKSIIADFFKQLGGAFRERDDAQAALTAEQGSHTTTKGLLETEKSEHGKSKTLQTNFVAALKASLGLTDEQVSSLTPETAAAVVTTSVTAIAQRKAVEIAAGQHVPPVISDPSASSSEDDEIATAFQMAREEKDPKKRGALYQRASNLVKQKKSKAKN